MSSLMAYNSNTIQRTPLTLQLIYKDLLKRTWNGARGGVTRTSFLNTAGWKMAFGGMRQR